MVTVIFMVITIILFFGMIAENEKFNKRTYCLGFMTSVVAVTAMEIIGRIF